MTSRGWAGAAAACICMASDGFVKRATVLESSLALQNGQKLLLPGWKIGDESFLTAVPGQFPPSDPELSGQYIPDP